MTSAPPPRITRAGLSPGACLAMCAAAAATVLATVAAHAQSPAPPPASSASPAPVESPAYTEARERQRRGRALLEARDYNAALAEFQRVYDLLDGHPRRYMALSNIGRCYQSLGQYDRAMAFYQRYLTEGGAQAEDRATVEASIAALNDLLGTLDVTVTGPPTAEVWIDDRRAAAAPAQVRVPGGRHVVELRADGWQPQRRELQLSAHDTVRVHVTLSPLHAGLRPGLFIAGTSLTIVAAIAGAAVGAVALITSNNDRAQVAAGGPNAFLVAGEPSDRDPIRTEALAADILYGTAGVFAIATVVVFVLTDFHAHADQRPSGAPRAIVVPFRERDTAGLQLSVRF